MREGGRREDQEGAREKGKIKLTQQGENRSINWLYTLLQQHIRTTGLDYGQKSTRPIGYVLYELETEKVAAKLTLCLGMTS